MISKVIINIVIRSKNIFVVERMVDSLMFIDVTKENTLNAFIIMKVSRVLVK